MEYSINTVLLFRGFSLSTTVLRLRNDRGMAKILIFTATYNESDNITSLIKDINSYAPGADILVVDDASPDGTGQILDDLTQEFPQLQVAHRPRKAGLGSAHMLAMKRAIEGGYDFLVTMDADFSHHPKYLPEIIEKLTAGTDFVIGSRYVTGGKSDYGFLRQLLSRGANTFAITLLGLPLKETTTAYRGFRTSLLKKLDLDSIRSTGYSFFVEFVYQITRSGSQSAEIPIHFEDRRAGSSKISKIEILKGVFAVIRLFADRVLRSLGLKKDGTSQENCKQPTRPCPVCEFEENTVMFYSTSSTGKDGAEYQCTNTYHASHGQIVRCLGCGLIYTNPQLPAEDIEALYADVEDAVYLDNIRARIKTFEYNLSRIKSVLPSQGKLLDVGSYCGIFLKVAENKTEYTVAGVEPSRWAVEYCTRQGLSAFCGTLKDLPTSERNFDIITSWDVLEHVCDPMAELAEVNQRLRVGGVYAFSTLHVDNWFPKLVGERWPWYMDMHLYYFTNSILKHMLERNGFELIRVQPYCHIITGEYFLRKMDSLGVPFASALRNTLLGRKLKDIYIPFRFGDIQLFVARKVRAVSDVHESIAVEDRQLSVVGG